MLMGLTLVKHKQEVGALQSPLKEIHSQFGQCVNSNSPSRQGHCQLGLTHPHPANCTRCQSSPSPQQRSQFFQFFPQPGHSAVGVTDPRRGGKGLQSSLNSSNLQGRGAQRSVKSPARPYFSHEFPLLPPLTVSALLTPWGLEFQLSFLIQAVRRSQRLDFSGGGRCTHNPPPPAA